MNKIADDEKGFFLVIEGLDGSGKSEVSRLLVDVLDHVNPKSGGVMLTFEPHDPSCGGLYIRQVLTKKVRHDPRTLALAFAANRADHLSRVIVPFTNLSTNHIVICDRYYLSSLVYQTTEEISIDEVMRLNAAAIQPDLTIFLNATDSVCYDRMRKRADDKELFEVQLRKTRTKYLDAIEYLQQKRGDTIVEINADGSINQVINSILDTLKIYGPVWLKTQLLLPTALAFSSPLDMISINGVPNITLHEVADELMAKNNITFAPDEQDFNQIKSDLESTIYGLPNSQIAALFINYIQLFGYKILGEIPWSDTKALSVEFSMPLDVIQQGVVIFLNRRQHYSLLTKKIFDLADIGGIDAEVTKLSDFVICFDFSSQPVALRYFERDFVFINTHLSPTVRFFTRLHIEKMMLAMILAKMVNKYRPSLELKQLFNRIIAQWGLESYWNVAVRECSKE